MPGAIVTLGGLPATMREQLWDLAKAAQEALSGAEPREIAQATATLGILPAAAMDPETARVAVEAYRIALADMPGKLLQLAVKRALRTCKFRPTPAELRGLVAEEWAARRRRLNRLRAMIEEASAPPPPPVVTPEEAAAILAEYQLAGPRAADAGNLGAAAAAALASQAPTE